MSAVVPPRHERDVSADQDRRGAWPPAGTHDRRGVRLAVPAEPLPYWEARQQRARAATSHTRLVETMRAEHRARKWAVEYRRAARIDATPRGATQRQRSLVAVAQSDARYALGKLAKADRARANEWMRDAVAIIDRQRAVDSLRRPALAAIGT